MSCLGDSTLAQLLSSSMGEAERTAALGHLFECDTCRRLAGEGARLQAFPRLLAARYHVRKEIGRGAMGTVVEAWDERLDRRVALKLLRAESIALDGDDDAIARGRFVREAKALARLCDEHVVQVHDVGCDDAECFIVMEHVEGCSLRRWSRTSRTLAEKLRVVLAAGRGLLAIHDAGLIHRDFKPDNVLVTSDGRAKVVDFGLAAAFESKAHLERQGTGERGQVVGTPAYMPPEQFSAAGVDEAADVFSFCATAFEVLHGGRAFVEVETSARIDAIRSGRFAAVSRLPRRCRRLQQVLEQGLKADPHERPPLRVVVDELERAVKPRRRSLYAAASGLVLLLGGGAFANSTLVEEPVCNVPDDRLRRAWSPLAIERLQRAVQTAEEASVADMLWARARPEVDAFVAGFDRELLRICRARRRQEISERDARAWEQCLVFQRTALAVVLEYAIEHPMALRSVAMRQQPGWCRTLTTAIPFPAPGDDELEHVSTLVERLAEAGAVNDLGHPREARRLALELASDARAAGEPIIAARAVAFAGLLEPDLQRRREQLEGAAELAHRVEDPVTEALAWVHALPPDDVMLEAYLRQADAALLRVSNDAVRELAAVTLAPVRARWSARHRSAPEGIAEIERALILARRRAPWYLPTFYGLKSVLLREVGQTRAALDAQLALLRLYRERYTPDVATHIRALALAGRLHREVGEQRAAQRKVQQARVLAARSGISGSDLDLLLVVPA